MKALNKWEVCLVAFLFVLTITGCQVQTAPNSATSSSSSTPSTTKTTTSATAPDDSSSSSNNTVSGLDGNPLPTGNTASSFGEKLGQVAAGFVSRYARASSFPYDPLTRGKSGLGSLGCAQVVSKALNEAGESSYSLGVYNLRDKLLKNGWTKVRPPPYMPGDVIVWSPIGSNAHVGIVARNGNSLKAMNNSSSQKKPVFSDMEYRAVEAVYRKA